MVIPTLAFMDPTRIRRAWLAQASPVGCQIHGETRTIGIQVSPIRGRKSGAILAITQTPWNSSTPPTPPLPSTQPTAGSLLRVSYIRLYLLTTVVRGLTHRSQEIALHSTRGVQSSPPSPSTPTPLYPSRPFRMVVSVFPLAMEHDLLTPYDQANLSPPNCTPSLLPPPIHSPTPRSSPTRTA